MDKWWLDSLLPKTNVPNQLITSNQVNGPTVSRNQLSNIGQGLLDLLYSYPHPSGYHNYLEPYIVEFDRIIDNDDLVRDLGSRLGLLINPSRGGDPGLIFLNKLSQVIQHYGPLVHEEGPLIDGQFPSIPAVINMSPDQAAAWIKPDQYPDRLFVISKQLLYRS